MAAVDTVTTAPDPKGGSPNVDQRITRLSAASLRKVIDPDLDLPGSIGPGAVLPRQLLSVRDLDVQLTDEQWTRLSREELASILDAGLRFEASLMGGFGLMVAAMPDLTDPRVTYILHEVGEETRHSRMFARVLEQLAPRAKNPFLGRAMRMLDRFMTPRLLRWPALFFVMVLTGEEVPDLLQKLSSEHPDTDPFVREVNRYHRMEEARHLSFARALLPELWTRASRAERYAIRHVAPSMMSGLFDSMVHPGVYRTVGLDGWRTWRAVSRSNYRRQLKAQAFRPVLTNLCDTGAFGPSPRIPRSWRAMCRVDGRGRPMN